jgi:hypothetical protein
LAKRRSLGGGALGCRFEGGEVRVQGFVAGAGEAAVGAPHAHQGDDQIAPAALREKLDGGVGRAQPDADAIAEANLLRLSAGTVNADRADR